MKLSSQNGRFTFNKMHLKMLSAKWWHLKYPSSGEARRKVTSWHQAIETRAKVIRAVCRLPVGDLPICRYTDVTWVIRSITSCTTRLFVPETTFSIAVAKDRSSNNTNQTPNSCFNIQAYHYSEVTQASWRFKSPAVRLFVQWLVQRTTNEILKLTVLLLREGNPSVSSGFLSHRACNVENAFMSWHEQVDVIFGHLPCLQSVNVRQRRSLSITETIPY